MYRLISETMFLPLRTWALGADSRSPPRRPLGERALARTRLRQAGTSPLCDQWAGQSNTPSSKTYSLERVVGSSSDPTRARNGTPSCSVELN